VASELEWTERALPLPLGRVTTATLGGEALYVVNHRDLASHRIEGGEVQPWHAPVEPDTRVGLDDRNLQVAMEPDGTMWVLLVDGSLHRRERGGRLEMVAEPDVRLAGHYAHRVGFVWDVAGDQLVVVGGDHRNNAFALKRGARFIEPLPYGPGHGVGQTVATPHGVYRLVDDALWLLRGGSWGFVGSHPHARSDRGQLLFFDPKRDALFFVGELDGGREPPMCVQLTPGGTTPPMQLPGTFSGPLEMHEAVAQVDPSTDRLWMIDRTGARYLAIDALALQPGVPLEPRPRDREVVEDPPVHWYREALALRQRDEEADDLGIAVRDGWVLSATLPVSPLLPLANAGSVLLFTREDAYDHDPWTLSFSNAFEVRIVDERYPLTAGGMQIDFTGYREVEPIFAERVDTSHDGAAYFARRSKIGGFPALVYGTREQAANSFVADVRCEDCDARLRFVAQLAWPEFDLISAVVYLYACPFGHSGAAKAQNV